MGTGCRFSYWEKDGIERVYLKEKRLPRGCDIYFVVGENGDLELWVGKTDKNEVLEMVREILLEESVRMEDLTWWDVVAMTRNGADRLPKRAKEDNSFVLPNLKVLLMLEGLSMSDLAGRMGVKKQALSRSIRSKRGRFLTKISSILGVDKEKLMDPDLIPGILRGIKRRNATQSKVSKS